MQPAPMVPCMKCQTPIPYGAPACPSCGQRYMMAPPGGRSLADDASIRALLPVGRTALSIIAGYVAIFTLLFFPLGPLTLLLGILAARGIKNTPGTYGLGRAWFAIIVGILGTVGLAVAIIYSATK